MDYPLQAPHQLSAHLRALRRARGLSQAALGDRLGVGQTRVARIEANPTAVSVEQLIAVLAALGVQLVLRDAAMQPAAGTRESKVLRAAKKQRPTDSGW